MKLKHIAQCLALIGVSSHVWAQDADVAPVTKVVITGSNIKRSLSEGALPVQVLKREDIERAGVTNAEQLLNTISANANGSYNMSANQADGFLSSTGSHNSGASSANLRGLGAANTLVLLNGRRLATHGLNGSSVDLNSIPLAAIERVEVLKDGASAIYGTDAIGGVINFILRQNYEGVEVAGSGDITQHGGGNIYNASLLFGKGSLDKDGFNTVTSLAYDQSQALKGSQRSFQNGNQPDRGLSADTTGTPFATQQLPTFSLPGSTAKYSYANLLALQGKCGTYPHMMAYPTALWDNVSRDKSCSYDYGADWALMQPVKHLNLVSRTTFKLNEDNTAYLEVTASRTDATDQYTPQQLTGGSGFLYPAGGPYYQDLSAYIPGYDNTKDIKLRWRCMECGLREEATLSTTYRVLGGIEGSSHGWDYKLGVSAAGSKSDATLVSGYFDTAKMQAALMTGLINPWLAPGATQTAAAMDLIKQASVTGPLYNGKTSLLQADGNVSGELMQLPAGPLAASLGTDVRRESYNFGANEYASNSVYAATSDPALPQVSRTVTAVFAELNVPIVKGLESQLALRTDHYSDFGSTTNPKVALRWQPVDSLLFRGSWNKGFHAPGFEQLYAGQTPTNLNNPAPDPQLCPKHPGDPAYCAVNWDYRVGGNPNLKPETSRQSSLGMVLAPTNNISASLDYWQIKRANRILTPSPEVLLANFPQYVIRKADGTIDYIQDTLTNIATDKTKGVDLSMKLATAIAGDKVVFNLDGTYMISHATQNTAADPVYEYVGQFGDPNNGYEDLFLRWRHTASVTWTHGAWTGTLTEQFSSGYKDEAPAGTAPPGFNPDVASYSLFNLGVSYTGMKNTTFTVTVKNLFDKEPPFSAHNVDDVAGAGWDARVGQPRMRSILLAMKYKF